MYTDLLAKYKREHQFRLYAYCLLPERLHLLVEPIQSSSISKIMHDLNSRYTKHSNARNDRRGHLFESRFKSVLVEKKGLLAGLTRFVHRSAGDRMKDWEFSSYGPYISNEKAAVPMEEEIQEVKNDLKEKSIADYATYCADASEAAELEKKLARGGVLGSDEFLESVRLKIKEHTEVLKEEGEPVLSRPNVWTRVVALLLGASAVAAVIYLYAAKSAIETKYVTLLQAKELEFNERTSFENRSPIALATLEGTEWRVESVASLGANSHRDTLRFEDGQLSSAHFGAMGFGPTKYEFKGTPAGPDNWKAVQRNANGETLTWRGIWRGDALKGEVTFRAAAGLEQTFSFFSLSGEYTREKT